jgi:CheY-like chemotaxis protein
MLKHKRILVVEDNIINRVTYQIALMRSGAFVEFDQWGPGAIKTLKMGRKFDLIILDLMLPRGETGYHIFEEIRALPQLGNVPIIAVSAAEPSEAMALCRELGFDGYIAKPIDEEQFPAQLCRVLAGESVWIYS